MYNYVCREKGMDTSGSDFSDLLDRLETQGLISLDRGKGEKSPGRRTNRRSAAIASPLISTKCWITIKDETFVRNSFKDEALISSVLSMNLADLKFVWQ